MNKSVMKWYEIPDLDQLPIVFFTGFIGLSAILFENIYLTMMIGLISFVVGDILWIKIQQKRNEKREYNRSGNRGRGFLYCSVRCLNKADSQEVRTWK